MTLSRLEHDRRELCRRSGLERRQYISAMLRDMSDRRDMRERRQSVQILRDNDAIVRWMGQFDECRRAYNRV